MAFRARYPNGGMRVQEGQVEIEVPDQDEGEVRVAGQSWLPLRAASDTEFVVADPNVNARIVFRTTPGGDVEGATLHQGARETAILRTDAWQPGPDQLDAYAGRYFSPELETIYTLVVREGGLVAEHRWNDDLELLAVEEDVFAGARSPHRIEFVRDERGTITGFRISLGRTTGVPFERLE